MKDIELIFPPQWSPFQPPLSIPSLAAWLRKNGYDCGAIDANILLFDYLLSDEFLIEVKQANSTISLGRWDNASSNMRDAKQSAIAEILSAAPLIRRDLFRLKSAFISNTSAFGSNRFVELSYIFTKALDTYLYCISQIRDYEISPYAFRLGHDGLTKSKLEAFVEAPPREFQSFLDKLIAKLGERMPVRSFGISCIGQDQLPFTLLIGKAIKRTFGAPVLVGGTVLSRMETHSGIPEEWFGQYFDVVVHNEGEKPVCGIIDCLKTGIERFGEVPGVTTRDGDGIVKRSKPAPSLTPQEIPTPDFHDLPLNAYYSAAVTLPVLSSRGCYWGKCEFCHHGMVYGEKYTNYQANNVIETIGDLSKRHGVYHFAFNDEAIPPKILRKLGRDLPPAEHTGYSFTGLIKFERIYTNSDFQDARRVGFKSLYVGLESASERVLAAMAKNNTQETVRANLRYAAENDIWMHCFLFYGFPTETEREAEETYEFVKNNADIIGSIGAGKFVLEYGAPISQHMAKFAIHESEREGEKLDLYLSYSDENGSKSHAEKWMMKTNALMLDIDKYRAVHWIPREHLLIMLSRMTPSELCKNGIEAIESRCMPKSEAFGDIIRVIEGKERQGVIAVNRLNNSAIEFHGASAEVMRILAEMNLVIGECSDGIKGFIEQLASERAETLHMYEDEKVI